MNDSLISLKWIIRQLKPVYLFLPLIILLEVIISGINLYNALIFKSLIDSAISKDSSAVMRWLFILTAAIILDLTLTFFVRILSSFSRGKLLNNLQKNLFSDITYTQWLEHSNHHSGDFLTKLTNDCETITDLAISVLPDFFSLFITVVGSFFILFNLEPKISIPAIIVFPFFVLISRIYGSKLKKIYLEVQEQESSYRSFMQESFQNILITKAFCYEKNSISKLEVLQEKKFKLQMKSSFLSSLSNTFFSLGSWGGYFLVLAWGILNLSKGIGTFGQLTAMLQLVNNVQHPLFSLVKSYPQFIASLGASQRLMEIESMIKEDDADDFDVNNFHKPIIEFDNVSFSYCEELSLLKNLSFKIYPGESIAFIGPSGEGKTTIIRMLLSLIVPKEGAIYLREDEKKVQLGKNFRNLISYIPQGNTLFSGTIEENLTFGNSQAVPEEIEEAVSLSQALNFISNMKNKFHTFIGEKGLGLSEGQAQRISIARALLRKKPFLILDEVTSALDEETEEEILNSIKNLKHKPTCIIITHRPSALKICDRIFKLEKGKLFEVKEKRCD